MPPIPDEQAALLRAIVASTDDDTPRLVYADWLQEHDDAEQAAFVRDSVRLAGMAKRQKGRKALAERLKELANERFRGWYGPLGVTDAFMVDQFERGFPRRVSFGSPGLYLAAAEALFAFVPIRGLCVETCDASGTEDILSRYAAGPGLDQLTDLRLFHHDMFAPEAWGEFFRSPRLSGLTHLTLGNCGIYSEETQHLAASPVLANLVSLDLGYNGIGVDGAQALLDSPHLAKLKTLCLEHNFFGEDEDEDAVLEALEERFGDGLKFDPLEDYEDEDA